MTKPNLNVAAAVRRLVLVAAAILLLSPASAWAWSCEGHQAVALIAEKHLSPHAREEAEALLRSVPADPALESRCRGEHPDPIVDSASWADDIRKERPETASWHYIDIPLGAEGGSLAEYCAGDRSCVTRALAQQIKLLRNASTQQQARADALRFIIHFVADLHQPLHCVTNNDLGGNCVPIAFFDQTPIENRADSYSPNLHGIWDYNLVREIIGRSTAEPWADALNRKYRSQEEGWNNEGVNLDDWAWSSHKLAVSIAYGKLPVWIHAENPERVHSCRDDGDVARRMGRLHERVSKPYLEAAEPTVDEQIAKAGVRLAMILNQIWP